MAFALNHWVPRGGACSWQISIVLCAFLAFSVSGFDLSRCFGHDVFYKETCCWDTGFDPCFNDEYSFESCCDGMLGEKSVPPLKLALIRWRRKHIVMAKKTYHTVMFASLLLQLNLSGIWLEVGVQRGSFSSGVLDALQREKRKGAHRAFRTWYFVDTWKQYAMYQDGANVADGQQIDNFRTAIAIAAPFWKKVQFLQVPSVQATRLFEDESLDFVYLDARHDYCGVADDLLAWWPKLRAGGLMGGDDFGWSMGWTLCSNGSRIEGGVKRAVEDILVGKLGVAFYPIATQWVAQK